MSAVDHNMDKIGDYSVLQEIFGNWCRRIFAVQDEDADYEHHDETKMIQKEMDA